MLKLYNTMTESKEIFKPREGGNRVKIFTCGPSIYCRPHIGNYRTFLYEDVLLKYLESLGYKVLRIINFTDVEDKIIAEAAKKNTNIEQLADINSGYFFSETKLLNIKLPPFIPRSSTCVPQAARIITELMEKGYAYRHNGDIFFEPLKFKGFGKLFGLDMSRWPKKTVRFRKDNYTNRWNRGDFILWHGHKDGQLPVWDTEIGKGRPSWNIQDPAIVREHLGPKVDITCGGIDNIYRHHDYNIAIMETLSNEDYAKYYIHGEHLIVNGKPMSKSRGNIVYPEDILRQGFKPFHLRFFLIYSPYRKKLNFTERNFKKTAALLDDFRRTVAVILKPETQKSPTETRKSPRNSRAEELTGRIREEVTEKMDDNLRVGDAFNCIFPLLTELKHLKQSGRLGRNEIDNISQIVKEIDSVWGVIL